MASHRNRTNDHPRRRLTALALCALLALGVALAQPYAEAPELAERVAAGDLPPVDERLPADPLVYEPVDEIGSYGGVIRRAFLGPADSNNYVRWSYDALVRFDTSGSEIIPHIAAGWDASDDFHTWTLRLREGAKWSDGEPFTSADIVFWYEGVILNEDLTPSVPAWLQNTDGSVIGVEADGDYAVRFSYDRPNTLFLAELAFRDGGDRTIPAFIPRHYLEEFHPDHADAADLASAVSAAGFDTWTQLFMARAIITDNPDRPGMGAWVPHESTVSDQEFVIRRNPYFVGVDTAGNQLPYVDEVRFRFFSDAQTLNFAAVAGEFDFQARHINMTNFPVLVQNAERGGYRVMTWPTFGGSDAAVWFNQNYDADAELGELLANRDFRIALSHATNRDEIRESAFLGLGEIRQNVPAPWHPYYPGDEVATRYTEFDPERANEILDGLGLERGAGGMRTLPSGRPLNIEISIVPAFGPWTDVGQLVTADWNAVGVSTQTQVRERNAHFQMRDTNELMVEIWNEDTTGFPFTGNPKMDVRSSPATTFATEYRRWYETDGAGGLEPTDEIKRMVEIIEEAKTVGTDAQIVLAQELFEIVVDQLYSFGTVGLTPLVQGVLVVNEDLANVPESAGNDWPLRTPGNARPEQFFYRR
ncbi:MAG: ABC transporter substrate-binding protein [Trueperaceae bacterium]|nr:ABC transporter substrate-binding protein [Trueperaceae bacterium]